MEFLYLFAQIINRDVKPVNLCAVNHWQLRVTLNKQPIICRWQSITVADLVPISYWFAWFWCGKVSVEKEEIYW